MAKLSRLIDRHFHAYWPLVCCPLQAIEQHLHGVLQSASTRVQDMEGRLELVTAAAAGKGNTYHDKLLELACVSYVHGC